MSIDLGAHIRQLRLSRSMTQEQLAEKLHITAQAVSKWENGTSLPDIQLLPELSVIFGVTIDELFSLTDESRMERIENRIYDVRFLSRSEFEATESWLRQMCGEKGLGPRATLLLAMLYNKRAKEYLERASPLARRALQLLPGQKEAHNAVFDAEGGAYADWNFVNHHKLIDFYKTIVEEHPDDRRNYYWLLDLLIDDGRTEEARRYAERMRAVEDTYHYELYMGNICRAECDLPSAMTWWKRMTEKEPESWIVWASYGDAMAKLGRYEEAIVHYRRAMDLRPKPRYIDCEEAVADICEILGDHPGAIAMREQILDIMKTDWGETEGEGIDFHLREIERLRERMKTDKG